MTFTQISIRYDRNDQSHRGKVPWGQRMERGAFYLGSTLLGDLKVDRI